MKKLKISASALQIRIASLPVGKDLKVIKLTRSEAFGFNDFFSSFDDLKKKYGAQKVLHEGEMYNGYVAIVYGSRSVDVVYMYGRLLRIDPSEATICYNYMRAEVIRQGKAWEITTEDAVPCFNYVWTFNNCRFDGEARRLQEVVKDRILKRNYSEADIDIIMSMDPECVSTSLKYKLEKALLSSESICELTESEDLLLRSYLGEELYRKFFCAV